MTKNSKWVAATSETSFNDQMEKKTDSGARVRYPLMVRRNQSLTVIITPFRTSAKILYAHATILNICLTWN